MTRGAPNHQLPSPDYWNVLDYYYNYGTKSFSSQKRELPKSTLAIFKVFYLLTHSTHRNLMRKGSSHHSNTHTRNARTHIDSILFVFDDYRGSWENATRYLEYQNTRRHASKQKSSQAVRPSFVPVGRFLPPIANQIKPIKSPIPNPSACRSPPAKHPETAQMTRAKHNKNASPPYSI